MIEPNTVFMYQSEDRYMTAAINDMKAALHKLNLETLSTEVKEMKLRHETQTKLVATLIRNHENKLAHENMWAIHFPKLPTQTKESSICVCAIGTADAMAPVEPTY